MNIRCVNDTINAPFVEKRRSVRIRRRKDVRKDEGWIHRGYDSTMEGS